MKEIRASKLLFADIKISKVGVTIAAIVDFIANVVGVITTINISAQTGGIIIVIALSAFAVGILIILIDYLRVEKAVRLYKKCINSKHIEISSDFHHIIHTVRNITQSVANNDYKTAVELKKSFEEDQRNLCTKVEEMYKKLFDRPTSVCIKMINTDDIASENYKDWKIVTFARGFNSSGAVKGDRGKNDHKIVYVKENSDFLIIIEGIIDYFVSEDMSNIRDYFKETYQVDYLNSRENNEKNSKEKEKFSDYYNATIVIPIRIEQNYHSLFDSNCKNYHLLGFFASIQKVLLKHKTKLINSTLVLNTQKPLLMHYILKQQFI